MDRRVRPRHYLLRLAVTLAVLLFVVFAIAGVLGLDSHAAALTGCMRAVLSGSDGPTVVVSGAKDDSWIDGASHTVAPGVARVERPSSDGAHTLVCCATDNAGIAGA